MSDKVLYQSRMWTNYGFIFGLYTTIPVCGVLFLLDYKKGYSFIDSFNHLFPIPIVFFIILWIGLSFFISQFKITSNYIEKTFLFRKKKVLKIIDIQFARIIFRDGNLTTSLIFYTKDNRRYNIDIWYKHRKVLSVLNELKIPIYITKEQSRIFYKEFEKIKASKINIDVVEKNPLIEK